MPSGVGKGFFKMFRTSMGKIIFLSVFFSPVFSGAKTELKTVDFLNKINTYYYCLLKNGLKNIRCEVSLTLPDRELNQIRSKYGAELNSGKGIKDFRFNVSSDLEKKSFEVELISPMFLGGEKPNLPSRG